MKLEQQVCSLELAKKLKELGVKQESLFYWQRYTEKKTGIEEWDLALRGKHTRDNAWSCLTGNYHDGRQWISHWVEKDEEYSAFTVAELGEMLPKGTQSYHTSFDWCLTNPKWATSYIQPNSTFLTYTDTEANARAKMLIYLIEE